jgi:hypothetical protein
MSRNDEEPTYYRRPGDFPSARIEIMSDIAYVRFHGPELGTMGKQDFYAQSAV